MNKVKKSTIFERSNIVKNLMTQYGIILGAFFLFLYFAVIAADIVLSRRTWYDYEPLWPLLHWLQENIMLFFLVIVVAGWLVITIVFMLRALYYLRQVVEASEKLAMQDETPLHLSSALKKIQDELNQVQEQSRENRELAKDAERRKNDLIVYLAHDLKTPLTSVIGYLTLLVQEPDLNLQQRSKFTGIALEKAERLETLINEFFDITRFSLSSMNIEKERINLSRMMEQLASEFMPVMAEKGLNWKLQLDKDIYILCDPDKMERVFDNLIRNAINYSFPDSNLLMRLRDNGDTVQIRIANHGRTIAPEKLSQIFEQFFRLDESRASSTGGAGLGLAIAKEIVELHGGTILAESQNEIICFTVKLSKEFY